MELAMATAAIVEPGPTGVSSPSIVQSASAAGVHRSMTRSTSSRRRLPTAASMSDDIDCATDVTAITRSPRRRAPRAISTGTAVVPPAEKTTMTSEGPKRKLDRMTSARPGIRSMYIAWRWPLAPTTWVWNVIDSSTIGLKPGYEPYRGNISSTGIREWPVPKRWTRPSAAIASADHWLAVSIADAWVVATLSRTADTAAIQGRVGDGVGVAAIVTRAPRPRGARQPPSGRSSWSGTPRR